MKSKRITHKATAFIAVFMLLAVAMMALVPHGTEAAAATEGVTLKITTGANPTYNTWKYLNVSYSEFPYNLSFRFVVKSNTGSTSIQTITDSGCTQKVVGNIYYLNSTAGDFKMKVWFNDTTDASGEHVLDVRAKTTTLTNQSGFNTTSMMLYLGKNSGADEQWVKDDFDGKFHDYYGMKSSISGFKSVKYNNSAWLLALMDNYALYGKTGIYVMTYGTNETGFAWTNAKWGDILDDGIHIAFKFKKENPYPQVGPKILSLVPFSSINDIVTIFDNEKIYKEAASEGYTHVIIFDQWMEPGTYAAYSTDVYDSILNIRDYCHKYNLKFTLYFGWRDFTSNGAYSPIYDRTEANVTAIQDSWTNFHMKWKNYVDFYYFDFAQTQSGGKYWKYYGYKYLDPIFKNIKAEGKQVIYNAGTSCWWADSKYFIPLKFEAKDYDTVETFYAKLVDGDPYLHTLNYSSVWWISAFFHTGSSWEKYNSTAAAYLTQYLYDWGIVPVGAYHYGDLTGFTPYMKNSFKDWVEGTYRTADIAGLDNSAVLETSSDIYVISQKQLTSTVSIDPKIAKFNGSIYLHSHINKTSNVELMITPGKNTKVYDETAGKYVNWTKGSVIFNATEGHTYKIYNETHTGFAGWLSEHANFTLYQWAWIIILVIMAGAAIYIWADPHVNVIKKKHNTSRRRH